MSIYLEPWAPDYGSPIETQEPFDSSEQEIDYTVEQPGDWSPVLGSSVPANIVAFVDGVRHIDGRLTLFGPDGIPVAGVCGSYGVGAAIWDRETPIMTFEQMSVGRLAIQGAGMKVPMPYIDYGIEYEAISIEADDPASLQFALHDRMRKEEKELASLLADSGVFVVADGPVNETRSRSVVGMVKAHHASYLDENYRSIIDELRPGYRSPLFVIQHSMYPKYSWYLRLADQGKGHSWAGIVRCMAAESVGLEDAARMADDTATLLPQVASEPHIDPRAPQNLVPIGALEKELRHLLGEREFVYRALLEAFSSEVSER